jgi:hypothetical protein
LAQAMEFTRGEVVEWIIEDRGQLRLRRLKPPAGPKKNGWTPRPLPRALGKLPVRQPPATRRRAGANPRPERVALSGTTHRDLRLASRPRENSR